MSELKPCPFCGSSDIRCLSYDPYDGYQGNCSYYIVTCLKCSVEMRNSNKVVAIRCVSLIALGWRLIWLHDISINRFWHHNVWAVSGVCSVVGGVFGTIYAIGKIFGGVL